MRGEFSVKEEEKRVQAEEEIGNSELGILSSELVIEDEAADAASGDDELVCESAVDADSAGEDLGNSELISGDDADDAVDADELADGILESDTADEGEVESGEDTADVADSRAGVKLIDPQYTKRLPFSLLAAFFGAFLGLFPATLLAIPFEMAFYPLFIAAPLLAFLLNKLFDGGRDIRTFSIIALFSLISAYMTALSCQVARIVSFFNVSILNIPAFTIEAFIEPGLLPKSTSAYLYPFVFTALGLAITWVLLHKAPKNPEGEESRGEHREADGEDVAVPVDGELSEFADGELSDHVDGEEVSEFADGEELSESADGEPFGSVDGELSKSVGVELSESSDGKLSESDDGESGELANGDSID